MEYTLDQALQKGVEAHKAGKVQEADRYYTAILKANPNHPDANHNMGVLAVGIGKVETALPFFKTALDTNPNIDQFWISYIDALIKLDRLDEASEVFKTAKTKGVKGNGFEQLKVKLSQSSPISNDQTSQYILDKAIELRENGKYDEAIDFLKNRISQFPYDPNLPAIISHCFLLNDNLEQGIIYLEKARNINPDLPSVCWNEARLLLKQKKEDKALIIAQKTNKLFPDDIEGMGILGSCLRVKGNFDESLKYLNKAIELKPNYAEALINRGLISLAQDDRANALLDLEKAHNLKHHLKQIWYLVLNLKMEVKDFTNTIALAEEMVKFDPSDEKVLASIALCYQQLKNYDQATLYYNKAVTIKPDYLEAYNNMGNTLQEQGKLEEAIKAYEKAISIKSDHVQAYYNMGNTLRNQGKLGQAIEAYSTAISIKPDFTEAYFNKGNVLRGQGKLAEAIEAYSTAISIKPDYAEALNNLGLSLRNVIFNKPNRDLQKTIVSLLEKEIRIRPKDILTAAISLLKFEKNIQKYIKFFDYDDLLQDLQNVIADLSKLPLLMKLMTVCPLGDLEFEMLLKHLRRAILSTILDTKYVSPELLNFQSALALQCFTNEYIYSFTYEEEKQLRKIEKIVDKDLKNKRQPSPQTVLTLASYKALNQYEWSGSLTVTDLLKEVITRQIKEVQKEKYLKSYLPVLAKVTDKVSSKVKKQYEGSPYPRWINLGLPLKPQLIAKFVKETKLKLHSEKISKVEKPEILIAGCGTGQHSIQTAGRFKDSNVLAVDLSLSSLAYAKRKTEELGIENIEYMQADILDLERLNKKFDIIESAGVLHHMDNPIAGWRILTDCLKPSGLMKIGLYSDLARQNIVKIRDEISQLGIGSSDPEMRSFRDKILKSEEDHHKRIMNSRDFYSMSSVRDLLFHVQEYRFTIPQINEYLNKLGLEFCGFDSNEIVSHFKEIKTNINDPYDLDEWHSYETAYPETFGGMYQFWCQKVD